MISVRAAALLLVVVMFAGACGSSQPGTPSPAAAGLQDGRITWLTLGCDEPPSLVVESSDGLETDVGLAADSLASTYGLTLDEAKRRLRLQEILGQRLSEVQKFEGGRVARRELQHQPYFTAVVTLTGDSPISEGTRDLVCATPELEVRLGARFTQDELAAETVRISQLLGDFGTDVPSFGPSNGELAFTVINDQVGERLDDFLSDNTSYPYVIDSLQIPPLVLDPGVPFPLLDVTGRSSSGVGLSGVLTIEGPCVYLNDVLVILPARETSWNAQTGVLNTGSGDLRSGDPVMGGGNEYRGALNDLAQRPDPSCRTNNGILQASFAPIDTNATPAPVPPPLPQGDLPGLRVHPRLTDGGMDAEVGGIVEIHSGCVWLSHPDGSRRPVIWPAGTMGQPDTMGIVLPNGEVVYSGFGVAGAGGSVSAQRTTESLGLVPFPPECIQSGG